jgi:hypothetical protein
MTDFTEDDLDRVQAKPRPRGKLPYLPDERDSADALLAWLTLAMRPPEGWRVQSFERLGPDRDHPALLIVANGRESRTFRFKRQRDLRADPRSELAAVASGWLAMPHLTGGEVEDVWMALCTVGQVLTEQDEPDQTREWIEAMLPVCLPLTGHTLVPDGRHAGLMALKALGEFTKTDALSMVRPGPDEGYQRRPTKFVDKHTGAQYLRVGETAAYLRYVVGVEPLSHSTLRARLHEIGVVAELFEDRRPPHPKLNLYHLTDSLIQDGEGQR